MSMNTIPTSRAATMRERFSNQFSNCCGRGMAEEHFRPAGYDRSEQNPQVPLASEDASLWQVPGNAETAVGRLAPRPPWAAAKPSEIASKRRSCYDCYHRFTASPLQPYIASGAATCGLKCGLIFDL